MLRTSTTNPVRVSGFILFVAFALAATGCSDSSSSSRAFLKILHASPDAPAVDVLVDDEIVLTNVPFGAASDFLRVARGVRNIKVNATGTATTVIDADLDLANQSRTTVAAVGNLAMIQPLVLEDNRTNAPSGSFEFRVIHAAASAPAVDVYVVAADGTIAGETPLLPNVPFQGVSDFLQAPAGDYRIVVTLAGQQQSIYSSGPVTLSAGLNVDLFAIDAVDAFSNVRLVGLTTDDEFLSLPNDQALVRFGHFSPDAPNVDISVDDIPQLLDVPYLAVAPFIRIDGGSRRVTAAATGTTMAALDVTADLADDTRYTVLAVDVLANLSALVLVDDFAEPDPGTVSVRLVHASPSAGVVDIYVTGPTDDIGPLDPTFADIPFLADTGFVGLPAGDYRVRITPAGSKMPVIDTGTLSLLDGQVRTAIAADASGGGFTAVLLEDRNP